MTAPRQTDEARLKRIIRYLKSAGRVAAHYPWRPEEDFIDVYADANWAGCPRTRRSTVGGLVLWNGHFLKSWSKTMAIIAFSSGESELGAVVRGTTEADRNPIRSRRLRKES